MAEKDYFWSDADPLWYKDAIIYELPVRAFCDGNSDGIGDFTGLTKKLDYLQDLGVTALWLLPFYPSPLKDDGYDISDYSNIHPNYGTLNDFKRFLEAAESHGLRVITELVLNHTSDQHPWFQRARRAALDSRWRDFYVWSDTPDKYGEARVIFKDWESSNWAWDPVAKSYYWHRFYSHQPDLNYDSPRVRETIFKVVDFWLKLGVSGLRLDAVPYLYERDGTICENLPETHAYLKELRRRVDMRFQGRVFLAEANQWAEDAAKYLASGDECHMAFHFPLMPRLFIALRMEDRTPVVDILEDTPRIPDVCQWALFLRNHDELTLEMVTDEERDYMYRSYAGDPMARLNLGIRRRLAPLLNNDRRKIELMTALLFSLPGTPIIYYGDEIGMGDNLYLGDRNGLRTPMQWNTDHNAGFSRASSHRLYLPVITDPPYHYESVNVEAQQNNPDSLLWWLKRLIALRRRFKAFGRGTLEFLYPNNRKVLAFIRRYQDETILVVANLSRLPQYVSLGLRQFARFIPVELFGQQKFPALTEEMYPMTLGPYAFYWLSLERGAVPSAVNAVPTQITFTEDWEELLRDGTNPQVKTMLLDYIQRCPWYRGGTRVVDSVQIVDIVPLPYGGPLTHFVIVQIGYAEGEPETYSVVTTLAPKDSVKQILTGYPEAVIGRLRGKSRKKTLDGILYDALADKDFCLGLLKAASRRREFAGINGKVTTSRAGTLSGLRGVVQETYEPSLLRSQQTNTSVVYGDKLILKFFHHLDAEVNPELEIGRALSEHTFLNVPALAGAVEYQPRTAVEPMTVGVLSEYIKDAESGWKYTLDFMGRYFEWVLSHPGVSPPPANDGSLVASSEEEPPEAAEQSASTYLNFARLLGERTGDLHLALSSVDSPGFAPEPFSLTYQRSAYHGMRRTAAHVLQLLKEQLGQSSEALKPEVTELLGQESAIMGCFQKMVKHKIETARIRIHGAYHLGEILYNGKDLKVIDFEGRPDHSVSERRMKRSPLRDVASMIHSFYYGAYFALSGKASTVLRPEDFPMLGAWTEAWCRWTSVTFLAAYRAKTAKSPILPAGDEDLEVLLEAYLLENALHELRYELVGRSDWVKVAAMVSSINVEGRTLRLEQG